MHSGTSKGQPHCSDPSRPCNPCLDATKACNLNENCKRQRSNYISTCTRAQAQGQTHTQDGCSRKRCHKALRQFFERVDSQYSYGLLFCACRDQACAERRRQTIVPSCSYQDKSKPNCLQLINTCRLDVNCRSVFGLALLNMIVLSLIQGLDCTRLINYKPASPSFLSSELESIAVEMGFHLLSFGGAVMDSIV
ncbi:hypothetical protein DNTS_015186 [Danionella cerebrum]|uniref:GDNF/GAS1 domain-containing protein n=1 Tax=Danionella cerebrum TaxID=2873325 RepID=A0A553NJJ8_9TELE|nr:hypothetical protein DNTS_015186 [Danionella translucida]